MTIVYEGTVNGKPFKRTLKEKDNNVARIIKKTLEGWGFKCEILDLN